MSNEKMEQAVDGNCPEGGGVVSSVPKINGNDTGMFGGTEVSPQGSSNRCRKTKALEVCAVA